MDALDGVLITLRRYKHNRHFANFSKPSRNFDALATSFEPNIDQSYVGLIAHGRCAGFVGTWCQGANVKGQGTAMGVS